MIRLSSNRHQTATVSHTQQSAAGYAYYTFPNPFGAYVTSVEMFFVDTSVDDLNASGNRWRANAYLGQVSTNTFGYTWSSSPSEVEVRVYRQTHLSGTRDAYFVFTQ